MRLDERAAAILRAPEFDFVSTVILINRSYGRLFEAYEVVPFEWHVLCRLAADPEPMTQAELARRVFRDPPAISRLVDQMEAKDLVVRRPNLADRREFQIRLTRRGRRLCSKLFEAAERLSVSVTASLTPGERRALRAAGAKMRAGFEAFLAGEGSVPFKRRVG